MSITILVKQQPEIELNYSNRNAALVLEQIGIDFDEGYGVILHADIPRLRRTLLSLLNRTGTLPTVAPEEEWTTRVDNIGSVPTITRELRYFDPGIDHEGVARRLAEVADLLAKASELNSDVSWY